MSFKTPSRSSPRPGHNRGCLCPDNRTYSRKCCNGLLEAQGIGSVAAPGPSTLVLIPYYWGISDTLLNATEITAIIESGQANRVDNYANSDVAIVFNAYGKYLWFAHSTNFVSKTKWYNTPINQGLIGGANSLFGDLQYNEVFNPYWQSNFAFYISNYPTQTTGAIIFQNP